MSNVLSHKDGEQGENKKSSADLRSELNAQFGRVFVRAAIAQAENRKHVQEVFVPPKTPVKTDTTQVAQSDESAADKRAALNAKFGRAFVRAAISQRE